MSLPHLVCSVESFFGQRPGATLLFRSVSVARMAERVAEALRDAGISSVTVYDLAGFPRGRIHDDGTWVAS